MNYRCRFCQQEMAFENGRYPYIRSMVLVHLLRCDEAGKRLLREDFDNESFRAADRLCGLAATPVTRPDDGRVNA